MEIANVANKPRSRIEILDLLKPKKRLEMEKLINKLQEKIYQNVQILEDYNRKKIAISVKNKLVKDLSKGIEKDDIFNNLTNNSTNKDK